MVNRLLKISNLFRMEVTRWNRKLSRPITGSCCLLNFESSSHMLLAKKAGKFRVLCTDMKGNRATYDISKSSLYHELGLTVRDLRFQHPIMLSVRNKKIIVRFKQLKALVCSDAVLLIDPPFDFGSLEDSSFEDEVADFWKTLPALLTGSALYTSNLPIEYRALEAVFTHALCNFSLSLAKLDPEIKNLLSTLTNPNNAVVDRSLVHILLKCSARLNTFSTEVKEFCEALEEILECEEDIRSFCITTDTEGDNRSYFDAYIFSPAPEPEEGSPPSGEFHLNFHRNIHHKYKINLQDEMETLLDSFLRDAEEIRNKVRELKEAIDTSNTAILINLDSHRNLLLRFELELTIGMFSCTLFGLIGMAFGMNLESSFEENVAAFWLVSGGMVLGAGIIWRKLLHTLRRKPLLGTAFMKSISDSHHPIPNGKPPFDPTQTNSDKYPPSKKKGEPRQHINQRVDATSVFHQMLHPLKNTDDPKNTFSSPDLNMGNQALHRKSNTNRSLNCSSSSIRPSPPKPRRLINYNSRMRPVTANMDIANALKRHTKKHGYCTIAYFDTTRRNS